MPIYESRPWRTQYFASHQTKAKIPTDDGKAWELYPAHRWIYNKLDVALSQGIDAGPHGTTPPRFPIFSKPIMNIAGMGAGSYALHSMDEYKTHQSPGHMWVTLLDGRHVSSDVAVVDGEPRWWRHTTGKPAGEGTFDYWTVHAAQDDDIEARCGRWVRQNLPRYTGMANVETIGGQIIEAHLRFAAQWPDLYGIGWVQALVHLYETSAWSFNDIDRRDGYSVVLFMPNGRSYRHPPDGLVEEVKRMSDVSSVQIPFFEDSAPATHSMPPGGFRVAIVNGFDLGSAVAARDVLKSHFLSHPQ